MYRFSDILPRGILFLLIIISIPARSQDRLPEVSVKTNDGDYVRLSDYTALGKPLIISFWATYCPPCLEEFSRVSRLYDEWKKEIDFEFIAVSIDDARSSGRVKGLAEMKKWPFIMLLDEKNEAKKAMGYSDIPYYYIADKTGKIIFSHEGYSPGDENIMFQELKKVAKAGKTYVKQK